VCTDKTGHAEVVQIAYEPSVVSYEELLTAFWSRHDPTTLLQSCLQGCATMPASWCHSQRILQEMIKTRFLTRKHRKE
ncbi:MAG: peptide-methionine (S)-S-oxide reductase, partial [Thaumarchaeota archaeon]